VLIVLEGVDNGGKSTLAAALTREFGSDRTLVWRQGPPPPDEDLVERYERPLLEPNVVQRCLSSSVLTVLDRWETGELVYGPLLRGGSRLSPGQALHVDLVLRSLGAVRVLVQPTLAQAVLDRYDGRGDDLVRRDQVTDIHAFYERHASTHGWYRGRADDEPDPYDVGLWFTLLPRDLLAVADEAAVTARDLEAFPGYVGWRQPDVLLVGERRGDGPGAYPAPWTNKAFTPLGKLGCSHWLLDALERSRTTRVGLVNAYEPGVDLVRLHEILGGPRVVALGNQASHALSRLGLDHGKIPHPQWARRFKHNDHGWYSSRLVQEVVGETSGETIPS